MELAAEPVIKGNEMKKITILLIFTLFSTNVFAGVYSGGMNWNNSGSADCFGMYSPTGDPSGNPKIDVFNNSKIIMNSTDGSMVLSSIASTGSTPIGGSIFNFYGTTAITSGVGSLNYIDFETSFPSSSVTFATIAYNKNLGTNSSGAGGHGGGLLGWGEDIVGANFNLIGAEGRSQGHSGSANQYQGLNGDAIWSDLNASNTTNFTGSVMGGVFQTYVFNHDGTTPRNQGVSYGWYVGPSFGSLIGYGGLISPQGGGNGPTYGVGLAIGSANYQTLQISNDIDPTSSSGGITFGVSNDTDLYRNASNSLKTDGKMNIGTDLLVPSIKSTTGARYICIDTTGKLVSQSTVCIGT